MGTTFGKSQKVEEVAKQVIDLLMGENLVANEIFDVISEVQKYALHKMIGEDFRALTG